MYVHLRLEWYVCVALCTPPPHLPIVECEACAVFSVFLRILDHELDNVTIKMVCKVLADGINCSKENVFNLGVIIAQNSLRDKLMKLHTM